MEDGPLGTTGKQLDDTTILVKQQAKTNVPRDRYTMTSRSFFEREIEKCLMDIITQIEAKHSNGPTKFQNGIAETNNVESRLCPLCNSSAEIIQFKKMKETGRRKKGQKPQFIWRYRCNTKPCFQFFGEFYRVKDGFNFVVVDEDGYNDTEGIFINPDSSAVSNADDSQLSLVSETCEKPTEPSSIDESTSDVAADVSMESIEVISPVNDNEPKTTTSPTKTTNKRRGRTARKKTNFTQRKKGGKSKENNSAILSKETSPEKKPRKRNNTKGYVYISEEPVVAPVVQPLVEPVSYKPTVITFDEETQTGEPTHKFSSALDDLNNDCSSSSGPDGSLPNHIARRLLIAQRIIKEQAERLAKSEEENRKMSNMVTTMWQQTKTMRDTFVTETTRIGDDVKFMKSEMKFHHDELTADAKKSLETLTKDKNTIHEKFETLNKDKTRLQMLCDLRMEEKNKLQNRYDILVRENDVRDKTVAAALKSKEECEKKLNDSLFITNNAKCAHCVISDKMRTHLTDTVAEVTVRLQTCQKERDKAMKQLESQQKIASILQKDVSRYQFEANAWKKECDRLTADMANMKESRSFHSSSFKQQTPVIPDNTNGVMTPNASTPSEKSEANTSKLDSPPEVEPEVGKVSPSEDQSPESLCRLPPPPLPPHAFSSWLPKTKPVDEVKGGKESPRNGVVSHSRGTPTHCSTPKQTPSGTQSPADNIKHERHDKQEKKLRPHLKKRPAEIPMEPVPQKHFRPTCTQDQPVPSTSTSTPSEPTKSEKFIQQEKKQADRLREQVQPAKKGPIPKIPKKGANNPNNAPKEKVPPAKPVKQTEQEWKTEMEQMQKSRDNVPEKIRPPSRDEYDLPFNGPVVREKPLKTPPPVQPWSSGRPEPSYNSNNSFYRSDGPWRQDSSRFQGSSLPWHNNSSYGNDSNYHDDSWSSQSWSSGSYPPPQRSTWTPNDSWIDESRVRPSYPQHHQQQQQRRNFWDH